MSQWHRFMSKVQLQIGTGCLIWQAEVMNSGYGVFYIKREGGRRIVAAAHRWIYEYFNGPIQKGMFVCHRCNNKLCVNHDHLYLADSATNTKHAQRDGLLGRKMDWQKVNAMRAKHVAGQSARSLAKEYAISASMAKYICNGTHWPQGSS